MAEELWLLNPKGKKSRGRKTMAVRRKRRRTKRKAFGFMTAPKRRRVKHRRRRATGFALNPRRRRRSVRRASRQSPRRRRSYGHNPPAIRTVIGELGWGAAGFMSTKIVGNLASPMLSGIGGMDSPIMRVALKVGIAYVSAWGLSNFFGQKVFIPAMLGGSMEAIQDAVKTFIAPTFPMLAMNYEPLETYYEPRRLTSGMNSYMGDGLSPEHDVLV